MAAPPASKHEAMGIPKWKAKAIEFAHVNNGFDKRSSTFVDAGVKQDNVFMVIRPTTPRKDRIETKLFGAAHGFRGPPPKKQTRGVARFDGCRESNYGASFYSNVNRITEARAARDSAPIDASEAAVNRMFKYLQASNQDIVANFAKFDDDGSGELDVDEFRAALLEMGLGMDDEQMGLVMREIDTDGGGTISIDEFTERMKQIDSRMTAGGVGTVQATLDRIFEFINEKKFRVIDMFNKIDVDGNGELDALEFHMCMKEMGMELDEKEVGLIMQKLDSDGGGSIGIDEFLDEMRKIHRKRRKDEKAAAKANGRPSEYEKKREASRYAAGGHPAIDALGDEAVINFTLSEDPEQEVQFARPSGPRRSGRWRPPSAERYEPPHQAFDSHYRRSAHNAFAFQDPATGAVKQRSLPDIKARIVTDVADAEPRVGPINGEPGAVYGDSGRGIGFKFNSHALNRTYVQRVGHKYTVEKSRQRRTMEAQQRRSLSSMA
jgi:Ca2+-binding EF-hand superfamily protein